MDDLSVVMKVSDKLVVFQDAKIRRIWAIRLMWITQEPHSSQVNSQGFTPSETLTRASQDFSTPMEQLIINNNLSLTLQ